MPAAARTFMVTSTGFVPVGLALGSLADGGNLVLR